MTATERLSAACTIALLIGLAILVEISSDPALFALAAVGIVLNGAVGLIARRLGASEGLVHLLQVSLGLVWWTWLLTQVRSGNPVVTLSDLLVEAVAWINANTAPMPPNVGVAVIVAMAIWALCVTTDMGVISGRRPSVIMLPMLGLYAVPTLAMSAPASVISFLVMVAGIGVVLVTDGINRLRSVGSTTVDHALRPGVLAARAGVGTLAVAAAVSLVAMAVIPLRDSGAFDPWGNPGPVVMADPSLDLKRNLDQPSDRPVLTYKTGSGRSSYLHLVPLTLFDAGGWHLAGTQLFDGGLPPPPGLDGTRQPDRTQLLLDDFESQWLPVPYAPIEVTAPGEWRHDPTSLSVIWAGRGKPETAGLSYEVISVDVTPSRAEVLSAEAGRPNDNGATRQLPSDLPPELVALAETVTKGATTDGQRALLLQAWFRSSVFTYSTEPAAGSSYDALMRFLFVDRIGYCEQFAAGMAVLARSLGIPARVAIGFLPGRKVDDHYLVTLRNMHAWPELYFEDLGWVSFEPTPSVTGVPPPFGGINEQAQTPTPTPTASTTSAAPPTTSAEASPSAPSTTEDIDLSWLVEPLVIVARWLLVVVVAGGLPWLTRQLFRRWRTSRRGAVERTEAAWAEVRDTVWDTGGQWPRGTPREGAAVLGRRLDAATAEQVRELALAVEQVRFDRSPTKSPQLASLVTEISRALWDQTPERHRWLRRLLPRSLWQGLLARKD